MAKIQTSKKAKNIFLKSTQLTSKDAGKKY